MILGLGLASVAACSGDNGVHHFADAPCNPTANMIEVVTPTAYACHEPFKAKVTVTNDSCTSLTVQDVKITAMVTAGQCSPAGPGTYPGTTIPNGQSGVALDLTSGPFCCLSPGCPASFQCDEVFTYTIDTSEGVLSKSQLAHLSLDNCSEICP